MWSPIVWKMSWKWIGSGSEVCLSEPNWYFLLVDMVNTRSALKIRIPCPRKMVKLKFSYYVTLSWHSCLSVSHPSNTENWKAHQQLPDTETILNRPVPFSVGWSFNLTCFKTINSSQGSSPVAQISSHQCNGISRCSIFEEPKVPKLQCTWWAKEQQTTCWHVKGDF